jgi:serine/threonine-protein kinase RsbW
MSKHVQLKLPSHTDYLDVIREFISKLAHEAGFDEENVYKIALALDEACTNVIRHAYDGEDEQCVEVEAEVDRKGMKITVSDSGKGFDPDAVETPNIEKLMAQHRFGGFGLYIIKTLMDEVDFSIDPGVRNEVRMTKYLKKN